MILQKTNKKDPTHNDFFKDPGHYYWKEYTSFVKTLTCFVCHLSESNCPVIQYFSFIGITLLYAMHPLGVMLGLGLELGFELGIRVWK